jgi:hypothetical protein
MSGARARPLGSRVWAGFVFYLSRPQRETIRPVMANAEESDPRRHERGGVGPRGSAFSAEGGVIRRCVTTGFTRMHEGRPEQ